MQDVYKNIDECNVDKENKILIVFDDMIADMINNKKLNSIVTELFIRGRKLNISLVFITQSYFKVPKDVRLNTTHFFIMKIPNKRELQQIALNHSSDISTKDFINIYKKCTSKPYSFLVNDATLASDNPLRFRKNLFLNILLVTKSDQQKIIEQAKFTYFPLGKAFEEKNKNKDRNNLKTKRKKSRTTIIFNDLISK